ncbi:MAG: hypothetical protein BroJett014_20950 [Planctomycetota bacterium]|nr:MAG: hypothetical protein BroJett014_20950 [Planctomycetota bacterium]
MLDPVEPLLGHGRDQPAIGVEGCRGIGVMGIDAKDEHGRDYRSETAGGSSVPKPSSVKFGKPARFMPDGIHRKKT